MAQALCRSSTEWDDGRVLPHVRGPASVPGS